MSIGYSFSADKLMRLSAAWYDDDIEIRDEDYGLIPMKSRAKPAPVRTIAPFPLAALRTDWEPIV